MVACSLILSWIDYCKSAMLCCTSLQHRRSTSSSKCRTTRLGSYFSHQDDPMPSRCFAGCTGCRSSRESCTRQQCLHSRSGPPQHQSTSAVIYRHVTVSGTPCCHDLPLGLTLLRASPIIRHLLTGTHFVGQLWIVRH